MISQRHLNLSISQRTVLVTMDMVRAALGLDADSVMARVEAGELRWVFDIATGSQISELRFWAKEIIAPEFCAGLTLAQAMKEILGSERARWRGTEIQHLLLVSRPTVKKLHDDGRLPGDLVNGTFSFRRAAVESFLRAAIVGQSPRRQS
jgi:hypothetical protein